MVILQGCLFLVLQATTLVSAAPQPHQGCPVPAVCGKVTIPFPFGTRDGCHLEGFDIACNNSSGTHIPYIGTGNIEILQIIPEQGLLRINMYISKDCYKREPIPEYIQVSDIYKFSNTRNKFVSIGCDTLATITDAESKFATGCVSICNEFDLVQNGSCSGIGCCETKIPSGMQDFHIEVSSLNNHTDSHGFSPCSYAFLADRDSFNFNAANFTGLMNVRSAPVTLEWRIGNETCDEALNNPDNYACVAQNSECYNASDGPGYHCNCSAGFEGNPYLLDGCQDIKECPNNPCDSTAKTCVDDPPGNYTCSCPEYMEGNGRKGSGCTCIRGTQMNSGVCKPIPKFPYIPVVIGLASTLVFLCANLLWTYWALKKRKLIKLKEKFFEQNGGFLLQQQISKVDGSTSAMKIFSSSELSEATNNFAEDRILGKGGFGTVYKGILPDKRVIAVKKSKITSEEQKQQFINEVVILSQINHRNVVKLLGCCLETQVPLLIYEFIGNGTLSHHIHDERCKGWLPLEKRLRIAIDVAEALAYLHTSTSTPIIHRDVKCSNILLDDNYISKVSDFGMSRLVPFDQNCLNSLVQGTFGYLDPEYMQTGQFTDKSDVYSFGVVLVQLLTGEKVVLPSRMPGNGNLVSYFISYCNENRLQEILENRVREEGQPEQLLAIAEVAKRCLCVKREERPTMKEVSKSLEELVPRNHPWIKKDEKIDSFLAKPILYDPEVFGASSTFSQGESSYEPMLSFSITG